MGLNKIGFEDDEDDIVALASPYFNSALSIIRSSGKRVIEKFSQIFSNKSILKADGNTIHYGFLSDLDSKKIDEVLVCLYRAPKSFTGQDSIEVIAHGSTLGIKKILSAFYSVGFRDAKRGEFTFRAFLSGKLDLTKAEAIHELIESKTIKEHSIALNKLSGTLFNKIEEIKKMLVDFLSSLGVQLDYEIEEEERVLPVFLLDKVLKELDTLLVSYKSSKVFKEGISLVILGTVNSGKSSLFNLLLKEERAIVSNIEGTTRDYILASFEMSGVLYNIYDTAGFRLTDDIVENLGIERSKNLKESSDIVLYLVDASRALLKEERAFILRHRKDERVIFVLNKVDLGLNSLAKSFFERENINFIKFSNKTLEGFVDLEKMLSHKALGCEINLERDVLISSQRQYELLLKTKEIILELKNKLELNYALDILSFDISNAIDLLGEITGEVTSEEILDNMFSKFCLGK